MSRPSSPQDSAENGAPARPTASRPVRIVHECAERDTKYADVETVAGVARVRVRRLSIAFHVGGHGQPVPTDVYEVAVRTPFSVRHKLAVDDGGFYVTHPHFLHRGGLTPANALEVVLPVSRWVVSEVARYVAEHPEASRAFTEAGSPEAGAPEAAPDAGDRPPRRARRVPRPQLPSAPGMEEPAGDGPALRPVPPAEGVARPFRIVRPNRAA